jgi:hypothetical protein
LSPGGKLKLSWNHIEFNQREIKGGVLNKYKLTSLRSKVSDSKKIKANMPSSMDVVKGG